MNIGGLQRISLIDYPGQICAVVFTQGCNFRCPYCHNPELVDPAQYGSLLSDEDVFAFLDKRRGKLDAVTVTGGEPTLQPDLGRFLRRTKRMGYLNKIDTNGSDPDVLEKLIQGHLVDYLAMDIKGPFKKYERITNVKINVTKIKRSIELIAASDIEHEFRTTIVRSQLDQQDLVAIRKTVKQGLYVLQTFIPSKSLNPDFMAESSYSLEELDDIRENLENKHLRVIIR